MKKNIDQLLWALFIAWLIFGRLAYDFLTLEDVGYLVLLGFVILHFGLAAYVLYRSRFRIWALLLCLLGLVVGEWGIFQVVLIASIYRIIPFAP